MISDEPGAHPCWGYRGARGPDHWGDLHPDWRLCGEGAEQSPISLPSIKSKTGEARFAIHYQDTAAKANSKPHTLQVDLEDGCRLAVEDTDFFLRQFHFHTPSEHFWSGAAEAGEVHLVHISDAGGISVLGVALRAEAEQMLPESFWESLRAVAAGETRVLNPANLIPQGGFLEYLGSMTTPPCSEGVRWLLAAEPMGAGPLPLQWLAQRYGQNARTVQPLGARTVRAMLRTEKT